jgi:DNA-binding MarR family transcriptional regulator
MAEHAPHTVPETPALCDLPPSAKLVAKTLEYEGRLTQTGLVESTLLSPRTVREALTRLEEIGLVTSRPSFMDARQRVYALEPA